MQLSVLAMVAALVAGLVLGCSLVSGSVVRSCAGIGVEYLELGKRKLNITNFDSPEWASLVEQETKLVNECSRSLE